MKKLAILTNNINQTVLEITNYLKDKTYIVWLSENNNLLKTANDFGVEFKIYQEEYLKDFDLIASADFECQTDYKILKVHKSLLPLFEGSNPINEAIQAGVNVVGVSVYSINPYEIIAQYPIFFEKPYNYHIIAFELQIIEQILYPLVIEKVLNNEKFNTKTLMQQNSCGGNCGGCGGCH